MSRPDQAAMREWAQEHLKAARQCTTNQNAGTLPLNMYDKELPTGQRVSLEDGYQDSGGERADNAIISANG